LAVWCTARGDAQEDAASHKTVEVTLDQES
jgi:hypothetical protein